MDKTEQAALQATKEIVVKFIEVGRISPATFQEFFGPIYRDILDTVRSSRAESGVPAEAANKRDG